MDFNKPWRITNRSLTMLSPSMMMASDGLAAGFIERSDCYELQIRLSDSVKNRCHIYIKNFVLYLAVYSQKDGVLSEMPYIQFLIPAGVLIHKIEASYTSCGINIMFPRIADNNGIINVPIL